MTNDELLDLALQARKNARTSICDFKVGSALLAKNGEVFLGCNIQDPSGIGITNICAERLAIAKALSEGQDEFEKIAVVGEDGKECLPCGACLQYINSFAPRIKIITIHKEYSLSELLPMAFNL